VSNDHFRQEPTEEEVAAIVAVLFADEQSESGLPISKSAWRAAARLDAVSRWPQPQRLSRPELEDPNR
jgi:hypothetical protein